MKYIYVTKTFHRESLPVEFKEKFPFEIPDEAQIMDVDYSRYVSYDGIFRGGKVNNVIENLEVKYITPLLVINDNRDKTEN